MPNIAQLRERARQALGHKMFKQLMQLVPADQRNSPAALLAWVEDAGRWDQKGARRPEYRAANLALKELVRAEGLQQQVAALYHNPDVRRLAGDKLDFYFNDPDAARKALAELQTANPKEYWGKTTQAALDLLVKNSDVFTPVGQAPAESDAVDEAIANWSAPQQRSDARQAVSHGKQQSPAKSGAQAEFNRMLEVRHTNYAEYKSESFQKRLVEVAAAAKAERAAPAPAAQAPAAPSPSPQQGGTPE